MIEEIFTASREIEKKAAYSCLILALATPALLGWVLWETNKTDLQKLIEPYNKKQAANNARIEENPEALDELFPPSQPVKSRKEYEQRANTIGLKLQKLRTSLLLDKNTKLEYLLGRAVQEGLLHPKEANQILEEYTTLSATSLQSWQ